LDLWKDRDEVREELVREIPRVEARAATNVKILEVTNASEK
jgi:hypothetical protein